MTEQDIEIRRARDLERYHRQTAERRARGLCVKCGKRPPEPGRSQCEPCLEKDRAAGRARDARLRAAGIPRRDCEKAREYERERERRQTERRRAEGLCTSCGNAPAAPGRVSCEPCLKQRRAEDRTRYAAGKAAGKPYGGADAETKRRAGRARSRRRKKAWREAGLCLRCGKPPAVEGGKLCTPCQERRRAKERRKYAEMFLSFPLIGLIPPIPNSCTSGQRIELNAGGDKSTLSHDFRVERPRAEKVCSRIAQDFPSGRGDPSRGR